MNHNWGRKDFCILESHLLRLLGGSWCLLFQEYLPMFYSTNCSVQLSNQLFYSFMCPSELHFIFVLWLWLLSYILFFALGFEFYPVHIKHLSIFILSPCSSLKPEYWKYCKYPCTNSKWDTFNGHHWAGQHWSRHVMWVKHFCHLLEDIKEQNKDVT